ncbi:hypothetical protein EDB92DRAFT_1946401 [Lactarius akahatsu]|uniref:Transmembrane protein n=1 Tax=Lactarius akahatsu TaxID=416441 RepID=A0AAD4QAI8_9AGAM|nr:hypothetical protein EDB92DRAFT_1946401 [Lactarius akahatsu]
MSSAVLSKDFITVVKMLHFIDGIKVWYFVSNLDFDWKILTSRPAMKWPSLVYLASRFISIACVVSFLVGLNVTSGINCQAWISTAFALPLIELELCMVLIVIRVIAIWKCSITSISLTITALSVHSGVALYLLIGIRSFLDRGPNYRGCVVSAPRPRLIMMSVASIVVYAFLLVAMLVGLLRYRRARSFRLWHMLQRQGWIWFALAVVAELPTLILVLWNINPSINLLLQVPRVVIASIGTTTMFRVLSRFKPNDRGELVNIVRLRADSNYVSSEGTPASLPLSPPLSPPPSAGGQVKISVHTTSTSTAFSDPEIAQKQEFEL